MKKIAATLLLLILCSVIVYGDIVFPDDVYILDLERNYKILLGVSPGFIQKHYGAPLSRKLMFSFTQPDYELWEMDYGRFIVEYQTFDNMVSAIEILSPEFSTAKNIKIGSNVREVISAYGNPTFTNNRDGTEEYYYTAFIREINIDGEYTCYIFTIEGGIVTAIFLGIISEV